MLTVFFFYFRDRIELFIDENKALMKRMYGEFIMPEIEEGPYPPATKQKRSVKPGVPDVHFDPGSDSEIPHKRISRQIFKGMNFSTDKNNESGR